MLLTYTVSCVLLLLAFRSCDVSQRASLMAQQLRSSFAILANRDLNEEEKERALRKSSLLALKETAHASLAASLTLAIAAIPIALGVWAGWHTLEQFVWFSIQWDVLLGTVAAFALASRGIKRLGKKVRDGA